jgi:hypothetical protein
MPSVDVRPPHGLDARLIYFMARAMYGVTQMVRETVPKIVIPAQPLA